MADPLGQPLGKSESKFKEEIVAFIHEKYEELQEENRAMLNQFHIEIIRQFEIQKGRLEKIIEEYCLEESRDDAEEEWDEKFIEFKVQKRLEEEDEIDNYLYGNEDEDVENE